MSIEEYLKEHFSYKAITSYKARINLYKSYNKNHKRGTLQEVLDYIKILRKQGKHPKTLRNHLHSIKIYYDYLLESGQRKDHPCKKLQLKDQIDKSIQIVELCSEKQLEAYFNQTPQEKKLPVSLLVYQGLRAGEVVYMKAKQIDLEKAELTLEDRVLPLKAIQVTLLLKTLKGKKPDDYILTTKTGKTYPVNELNAHLNTFRKKEDRITPLKIRQSVIKNLLKHNDLRKVQVWAGHRSSSTTSQYLSSDMEELKSQVENLHPLSII